MRIPVLLLVACDHTLRESLLGLTQTTRFRLVEAPGKAALSRFFESTHPDLVVIGPALGHHGEALRISRVIRQWAAYVPIVLVTPHGSEEFAVESMRAGINDYFRMPLDRRVFGESVRRLLPEDGDAAPAANETRRKVSTPWIGAGAIADQIRSLVPRIAASDCNVLITGETGTGKELLAELIHVQSRRSKQPFVSINCAAIPETLLESELFGYERGAFTGAGASSSGRLSAAHRGTAFLDEVGDMSQGSQAKVLRLVEDKEVTRLGSTRTVRVDARIIAATNQKLEALVAEGRFRSDLFFRLNVARVHLPPLRERKDDIPALLAHFLSTLRAGLSGTVEGFSRETIAALTAYDWPGNIRELRNLVERVLVQGRSAIAGVDDLPDQFRALIDAELHPGGDPLAPERARLRGVLETANGNKSEAARALRCSRMTLYRRMARCGLRAGSRRRA